ncbi:hypothetical protein [Sporolactobacillus shoreae]|uniref:hypothetical protein n=1 Tax=Sporolactobacillus shoreae TaxID=1465501 RepID=UPI00143342C0|nr:hypothetical protein [Sporolactobacillus shoreae]
MFLKETKEYGHQLNMKGNFLNIYRSNRRHETVLQSLRIAYRNYKIIQKGGED